jgi:hypothetical protein
MKGSRLHTGGSYPYSAMLLTLFANFGTSSNSTSNTPSDPSNSIFELKRPCNDEAFLQLTNSELNIT